MKPLNIAVVGSGISGLSSAWLLSQKHNVTLFEASNLPGGHSNTVDISIDGSIVPVDTGFICFNDATYPNLIALFDYLGVPTHETTMSFAASVNSGDYEYAGGKWLGMIAQPKNALRLGHWQMIADIFRFFREGERDIDSISDHETLGEYLSRNRYSKTFIDYHLLPMAAAIWSSKLEDMTQHPAKAFMRFFSNHGLIQMYDRPQWRSVLGGSREYVERLIDDGRFQVRTNMPVSRVVRDEAGVTIHTQNSVAQRFDQVVIASHADQALAMLDTPSSEEQRLLGAFSYSENLAVLHRDRRFMPKRKLAWGAWNYIDWKAENSATPAKRDLCVTYWMNELQQLRTKKDVFVTLNPPEGQNIENEHARFNYMHPVFDTAALQAQAELWNLQGLNRTWFCGAHFGAGFHEDGLQSGLAVAEQLGGVQRPWNVENESGRITLTEPLTYQEAAE